MRQFVVMLGGRSKRNPKRIEWSVEFEGPEAEARDVLDRYRHRIGLRVCLKRRDAAGRLRDAEKVAGS